jgi:fibronectin type 3 domain-containing protein
MLTHFTKIKPNKFILFLSRKIFLSVTVFVLVLSSLFVYASAVYALDSGFNVSGLAEDPYFQGPVSGVNVKVTTAGDVNAVISSSFTDNGGYFNIYLPLGTYDFYFSGRYTPVTYTNVHIDSSTFVGVILKSGLAGAKRFSGLMKNPQGNNETQGQVWLFYSDCIPNTSYRCMGKSLRTDGNGRFAIVMQGDHYAFRMDNVPEGGPMHFFATGSLDLTTDRDVLADFSANTNVQLNVKDSNDKTVTLPLEPALTTKGSFSPLFEGSSNITLSVTAYSTDSSNNENFSFKVISGMPYQAVGSFRQDLYGYAGYVNNVKSELFEVNGDSQANLVIPNRITAPQGVKFTSISNEIPSLSWDKLVWGANYNINYYNVYRDGQLIGTPTSTTFTDTAASFGSHSYQISGVNIYDAHKVEGALSLAVETTYQVAPDAPTNLATVSPAQVPNLSWVPVAGVTQYNIYRDGEIVGSSTTANYVDTSAPEGSHEYSVTAVGENGTESLHSNTVTVSVDKTAPTISYSVSPVANSLGWNSSDVTVTFSCDDGLSGVASCSSPVTISSEGANQQVSGEAVDNAGNTANVTANLNVDKTSPTIDATLSAAANANGWNNTQVTVTYNCNDSLSGVQYCSMPQTLTTDGTYDLAGYATDNADNSQTTNLMVKVDQTAPEVSNIGFDTNPVSINTSVVLSANVADTTSGVAGAEYYLGIDPGAGNGTPMNISGTSAAAAIPSFANAGMYTFYVRALDNAGNWSQPMPITLDVYNPTAGYTAGHGFIEPNGDTSIPGDTLPAVTGNNVRATIDFSVKYNDVNATFPEGVSTFTWGSGNCKKADNTCFVVNMDDLSWLVVPGDDTATFQGLASLSLNGQSLGSGYVMRVSVASLASGDHYLLQVYQPASNPDIDNPIYQASGDLVGGSVRLHP